MSINQLVKPVTKKWLDTHIGGVTIDRNLFYDDANKAENDSLVLDVNKIARWVPIAALTLGSVFVGNLLSTTISTPVSTLGIASGTPYPAIYSIVNGNAIQVSEAGQYVLFTVIFSTDTSAAYAIEVKQNSSGIPGSRKVSGPSSILEYNKINNMTFYPLQLNAGDAIAIVANSVSGAAVNIFRSGSFVVLARIN